jgi:hypothetical protein
VDPVDNARRICLVSPGHVASNPRLVKEADALHEAGYNVHVVAGWYYPAWDDADREIYDRAPWDRTIVFHLTGPRVLWAKLRRNWARRRLTRSANPSLALAMRAQHGATSLLAAAAKRVEADLYIGHCLAGLAAAAQAAEARGKPYAFDAEDFHGAETEYAMADPALAKATRLIEGRLLPGCRHITAASPLIGQAYADEYGIPLPRTLLNVFPRAEAPETPRHASPSGQTPRLYWFSQTIGEGRGLEALVIALGQMTTACELHLRGLPAAGFLEKLQRIGHAAGFHARIQFHPTASAHQMARLASEYDLGLSLEQTTPRNRDLCLTNKIFTYLLGGVPVALSPTTAQRALQDSLGDAAFVLDLAQPKEAAAQLDAFFADRARLVRARAAAWQLGQDRFNWDFEKSALLDVVQASLPLTGPARNAVVTS